MQPGWRGRKRPSTSVPGFATYRGILAEQYWAGRRRRGRPPRCESRLGMTTPGAASAPSSADDPLPEALALARGTADASLGLKLLGELAVRVLCPEFPPRLRAGQDIDFACVAKERKKVAEYLAGAGCEPDRRFNNLNGDRQMYFSAPSGRPIDVMVDKLTMCHILDFRPSFRKLPYTVDVVDLLLSKLQIVELNEKDARDLVQLLSCMPIAPAGDGVAIDADRFASVLGADWGWWRTVTGNLDRLPALLAERPQLAQPGMPFDPVEQSVRLRQLAETAPKSMK